MKHDAGGMYAGLENDDSVMLLFVHNAFCLISTVCVSICVRSHLFLYNKKTNAQEDLWWFKVHWSRGEFRYETFSVTGGNVVCCLAKNIYF